MWNLFSTNVLSFTRYQFDVRRRHNLVRRRMKR
jgi:hypothetical protein